MTRQTPVVALFGVGAMGRGFAKNLAAAGFRVQAFDLDQRRATEVMQWGAVAAESPSAAVVGATWIVTSLPGSEQVSEVLFGTGGAAGHADAGTYVIDTSTSLPDASVQLAERAAESDLRFIDASVSGTGATVMHRDVVALVGGDPTDFEACRVVLDGFARKVYHLGPVGSGAMTKLLINVVVVGNRLALAESLALGIRAGVDPRALLDVLKDGPSYSRAMDLKGEKMVTGDYSPESTLSQSLHGTELLLSEGRRVGVPLFGTATYAQVAQAAVSMGLGELDPAALLEALLRMSGAGRSD